MSAEASIMTGTSVVGGTGPTEQACVLPPHGLQLLESPRRFIGTEPGFSRQREAVRKMSRGRVGAGFHLGCGSHQPGCQQPKNRQTCQPFVA
ncbi:protein of unknown function [Methylococcus capsulatus]|uniref:Uncharacterized protein n=1 Tax=Methylococcus capsulatus TaxID=414 RepID=A0AA35UK69_METCP|nr:protein of unknown function [Methylococcus capsulatus]